MNTPASNRFFLFCLAVLVLTSLTPLPFGEWLDGAVSQLVSPLSDPLTQFSNKLRPPRTVYDDDDPDVRRLKIALAQAEERYRRFEALAAKLAEQVKMLQEGRLADPGRRFRFLTGVRRTATSSDTRSGVFRINAGRNYGVVVRAVVVAEVYQLVGRVESVDTLTSAVTPITDKASGPLGVVIQCGGAELEDTEHMAEGMVEPVSDGSLVGKFDARHVIQTGDPVSLRDPAWGSAHTGLLVGRVASVRRYDPEPLFNEVRVVPDIDVNRVSEVSLRIPRAPTASEGPPGAIEPGRGGDLEEGGGG